MWGSACELLDRLAVVAESDKRPGPTILSTGHGESWQGLSLVITVCRCSLVQVTAAPLCCCRVFKPGWVDKQLQ